MLKNSIVNFALKYLYSKHRSLYSDLFLRGRSISNSIKNYVLDDQLDILLQYEILIRDCTFPSKIKSKYLIYPIRDCLIITDFHHVKNLRRIFPIFHENIYLTSKLKIPQDGRVLDIGFGSGIFSLISAVNGASEVYATDVNLKAKQYAELGKVINGLEDKTNFLLGSVYEPLPVGLKFDLICSNPPFIPIPSGISYYIHSNGGPVGTDVIEPIIAGLNDHINPNGCFQMITMSLGNSESPFIMQKLIDVLYGQDVSITIKLLNIPVPLDDFIIKLKNRILFKFGEREIIDWKNYIEQQGLTHFHYFFAEANFGRQFSFKLQKNYLKDDKIRKLMEEQFGMENGIQWLV